MPGTKLTRPRLALRLLLAFLAAALPASNLPDVLSVGSAATAARPRPTSAVPTPDTDAARARFEEVYEKLPLQFESNRGQADRRFDFLSRGAGYDVLLSPTGAVFALKDNRRAKNGGRDFAQRRGVLGMKLVGANGDAAPIGEGRRLSPVNYFRGGDSPRRIVDVPTFGGVRYASVYPGVDVVYYGRQRELEYDFHLAPGADASRVRVQFTGAERLAIERETGDLLLTVGGREVRQHKPFAYQSIGGVRREVTANYVRLGGATVGVRLGDYDKSLPLVIDPVLSYSTYVGGAGFEGGGGIAVDAAGDIYYTGFTTSTDFPTTAGTYQPTRASSSWEVFVMKINPKATGAAGVVFSTYVGGAGNEHPLGIALDGAGNIYVAGGTDSTDFPVTANAFQTQRAGADDGIVFKLSPSGNALLYSSYLGGLFSDGCKGVAVDPAGNVYVAGHTYSQNMPTTAGAFQTTYAGGDGDNFVAKFNPSAANGPASLLYSTYLGGSGGEFGGFGLGLDAGGALYLTGRTNSANFPVTAGAIQPAKSTGDDLFITRLKPEGKGAADLAYSTFFGGQGEDRGIGLTMGRDESIYLTGYTTSPDFPVTKSALQSKPAGDRDFFVTKLDLKKSGAGALVYSTLVGGSAMDVGWDIAVDAVGNAYVTGETRSTDLPITAGAFQSAIGGVSDAFSAPGGDAFAAKLNAAGTALVYFTYLGGEGGDAANHIALDARGNAYVAGGYTFSPNFPTTVNALKTTYTTEPNVTNADAFVARIDNPSSFASNAAPAEALYDASEAAATAGVAALPNPIEDSRKFVRQQYRDFLNRAPDDAGLQFWTNEIESCGADAQCREVKRVNVSGAFFLSIEFQETGFLGHRLSRAWFARTPALREFSPDTVVVGQGVVVNTDGWQQRLASNKAAFVESWVQREDFRALYDAKTDAEYVDALFANAGLQPSQAERDALVGGLAGGTETRATVLRKVVENQTLAAKEFNRAFVLMQYFGYLQRSPDDPPDGDLSGYDFWLAKLEEFGGNYVAAEMVKAFISSAEYRRRFGED
ncbi:MAG: SBBP repeat-containing protein [Pyrinomonadaceae bacterium]